MPSELDPADPSRAAEVLDRMVRDRPGTSRRRSWQLRQPVPPVDGPFGVDAEVTPAGETTGSTMADPPVRQVRRRRTARASDGLGGGPWGLPWPPARRWLTAIVVLAAVATISALVLLRRPPPIEERLPVAGAEDAASSTPASSTAASSTPGTGSPDTTAPPAGAGPTQVVVHVAGAVTAPGVVRLATGSRVVDAVTAAGGLRPDADPDRVNLAAPLTDGQRVVVPVLGQPAPAEVAGGQVLSGGGTGGGPVDGAPAGPVDLNTATAEQLDTLPGVGPSTAAAIIEHRDSAGPFDSVDALLDVRGIGEAKLEALRDLVTVGGT